jgi:hypothetical protein
LLFFLPSCDKKKLFGEREELIEKEIKHLDEHHDKGDG